MYNGKVYSFFGEDYKNTLVNVNNRPITFDAITDMVTFNTISGTTCFFYTKSEDFVVGDKIKVQAYVKNISGEKIMFRLAKYNSATTKFDYKEGVFTNNDNYINNCLFTIKEKGEYRIEIGLRDGNGGVASFRNVQVEYRRKSHLEKTSIIADRLRCMIQKTGASTWIVRDDFNNDECVLAEKDANTLTVTFSQSVLKRGIAFASLEYYENSKNYIPRCSYSQKNYCEIQFFKSNDGTQVPLSSLPNIFLGVLIV